MIPWTITHARGGARKLCKRCIGFGRIYRALPLPAGEFLCDACGGSGAREDRGNTIERLKPMKAEPIHDQPGADLQQALERIMTNSAEWLDAPNAAFDGATPRNLIRRGERNRIWDMIHAVESGEPGAVLKPRIAEHLTTDLKQ